MKSIEEVKAQIKAADGKGVGYLPRVYFVGHVGQKTHVGYVFLRIDEAGRLRICCPVVSCGSARWGTRMPQVQDMTGTVKMTCKKCIQRWMQEDVDLTVVNGDYLEILPLIGQVV